MKFALHFGNVNAPDGESAKRIAIAAEKAGFDRIVAVEHVVWPTSYQSTYPYSPTGRLPGGPETKMPDPLIWFAYIAGVTTKLEFLTGILIVPQRNPLVLAKELATLDYMSGGRMNLGIGVGWLKEEFEALGIPFAKRGRRTDEYIAAMRALWAADDASYQGEFVRFDGVSCNPKPANGAIPIVVGGHSEAAARRAGRLGDGFFPATGAQVDIAPLIGLAREAAREAGRDPSALEITTGCPDALPGSGKDPLAALAERAAAGVHQVAVPIPAFGPDPEAGIAEFGEKVIARFDG